jgi:hypothetical protein
MNEREMYKTHGNCLKKGKLFILVSFDERSITTKIYKYDIMKDKRKHIENN